MDGQRAFARRLRKDATDAERRLWRHLRNRNVAGFKFRRQHPIGPYVVDFVCLPMRLIVELDGSQHMGSDSDIRRTAYLTRQGYRVVRYWNNDVLLNTAGVLEDIASRCRRGRAI